MSTVPITYGLRTIKTKVTPGTPVSELLEKVAAHFKLDPGATGLFHNNAELSLSLPFRFLNLPSGAKLTLKETKTKKVSDITIKVQFIDSPFEISSVVKKVKNQLTVEDLVKEIEKDLDQQILQKHEKLKFQCMNRTVPQEEFGSITLAQVGVESNGLVKLAFDITNKLRTKNLESRPQPKTEYQSKKDATSAELKETTQIKEGSIPVSDLNINEKEPTTSSDKHEDKMEIVEPETQETPKASTQEPQTTKFEAPQVHEKDHHIYIFKAPESPIKTDEPEEEEYEMTVSHARQYQNMLAHQAHDSNKAKRLRQEANHKKIENIEIKIKLPDGIFIQVNFGANETNKALYKSITSLLKEGLSFVLCTSYQPNEIINDDTILTENFETRNLLNLKSDSKGPFLKDEYLSKAKDFREAEDVKLELERQHNKNTTEEVTDQPQIENGVLPTKKGSSFFNKSASSSSSSDKKGKKVPSWLKLGKK